MNTHADKTQENTMPAGRQESQSVSVADSIMKSGGESTFQFIDNRPEAIAQRKLQEVTNNNALQQQQSVKKKESTTSIQLLRVAQFVVLQNVRINNKIYSSQPHDKTVYHMIVDPSVDSNLSIQIEKAKAFASAGANRHERLGLLFQYVDSLNKSEDLRNQIYIPTGRQDREGNNIREAYLGDCLNTASACRELSAFLQLILADEGVSTDYKVGTVGGMFNAQRHAWLQIAGENEDVIDPTAGIVGLKPNDYSLGANVDISAPINAQPINFDSLQESAYKSQVRTFWEKYGLNKKPKTLREKANESLETYTQERIRILKDIERMIFSSRTLTNLQQEGVFNLDVIGLNSLDVIQNEIIPQLHIMSTWSENPGE